MVHLSIGGTMNKEQCIEFLISMATFLGNEEDVLLYREYLEKKTIEELIEMVGSKQ